LEPLVSIQTTNADSVEALHTLASHPVVVTIDLHRGHLDPQVATLPLPAERCGPYVDRCVELLGELRALGIPVIHVVTFYRDRAEILSNRYWSFVAGRSDDARSRIADHNLAGGPGTTLMPGVEAPGDQVVTTKKRYDCLVGTDLEFMLRSGGHDAVLLLGVNTNSCLLATGIALSVRDWATFMIEDGVDSMMGPDFHAAGRRASGVRRQLRLGDRRRHRGLRPARNPCRLGLGPPGAGTRTRLRLP
jgi:nicotinamidase-related amidase